MPLRGLQEPSIKRYEQFKFYKNSENCKFKSDFPPGKDSRNILTEKLSQPHRNVAFFSKKWYQKTTISDSKTSKILTESKNGLKRLLRAFNQEL